VFIPSLIEKETKFAEALFRLGANTRSKVSIPESDMLVEYLAHIAPGSQEV
jgi:hypothetical protein